MKTIIIHESDFDINDKKSIDAFNNKLQEIDEYFEVKFDYPITEIPARLFYHTNLVKVTIPDSVIQIGIYAFMHCESLAKITLPNSITEINSCVFWYCNSLTKITLPNSINYLGSDIFCNCTSLQQITIQMSKKAFLQNVIYAQDFYNKYEEKIEFIDPLSLDVLLLKNNSLESVISFIEPEH